MNVPEALYAWLSLVAVPANVSTVPSPQDTLRLLTVPSGSVVEIVRVTVCPTAGVVVLSAKLTAGGLSVIILVEEDMLVLPLLSVTVTVTTKLAVLALPVLAYA